LNPRIARPQFLLAALLVVSGMGAVPLPLRGQVSLATVVDLAQKNSSAVKLAEADVRKASAQLAQTKDAFGPSIELGAGLPAAPAIGFTGGVPSIVTGSVQSLALSMQ